MTLMASFHLRQLGSLLPFCALDTVAWPHIFMRCNFSTHVCKVNFKQPLNPLTNDGFPLKAFEYAIYHHKLFSFSLGLGVSLAIKTNIPSLSLGLVTETL